MFWDVNDTYVAKSLYHGQVRSAVDKFFKPHPFLNNLDPEVTNIPSTLVQHAGASHVTSHQGLVERVAEDCST